MNVVARYREAIFDFDGGGKNARDVFDNKYKAYTSDYRKSKRTGRLNGQSTAHKDSNAPILTGALHNSFTFFEFLRNGFSFGSPQWGGKVKNLERIGRPISTKTKPIPDSVEEYFMDEAKKYCDEELKKTFKSSKVKITMT